MEAAAPLKYMVCNDGSEASIKAMEATAHGLMKEHDSMIVGHVWSKEKEEYLTYNLKRDYIKEQNEAEFTYLGKRFEYVHTEMVDTGEANNTAKEIL